MAEVYKKILRRATTSWRGWWNGRKATETSPPRTLRVTGPCTGITGYDHMVRCLTQALRQVGVQVELHDMPWSATRLPDAALDGFLPSRRYRVKTRFHLHCCMPQQVKASPRCRNINYTMFEANRISPAWTAASLRNDLTIVPTESSRLCWVRGGVPEEKVKICPLGTDFDQFAPGAKPLAAATSHGRAVSEFRLRFLNVSESICRKNLDGLLRVWLSATSARDDAVLLLKTGFYAAGSRGQFDAQLRSIETAAGKRLAEGAPVVFLEDKLAPAEMPRLYTTATHYWSMSRGEGFDLPMLEAAACGLQLIAPNHSAYRDYLNSSIAHLLPAREVPAVIPNDAEMSAFFAGANWWEPSEAAAAELIRGLIQGTVMATPSARPALMHKYTWEQSARRLWQIISET